MGFDVVKYQHYLKSDQGKRAIKRFFESRVREYIRELSHVEYFITNNEITNIVERKFIRFFERQDIFRFEQRHEIASSNIFNAFMGYVRKYGVELDTNGEDYVMGVWSWDEYIFKCYTGYGSYWVIYRGTKEIYRTM